MFIFMCYKSMTNISWHKYFGLIIDSDVHVTYYTDKVIHYYQHCSLIVHSLFCYKIIFSYTEQHTNSQWRIQENKIGWANERRWKNFFENFMSCPAALSLAFCSALTRAMPSISYVSMMRARPEPRVELRVEPQTEPRVELRVEPRPEL